MDIGRALTFFTDEERWIEKTTIGTLLLLVSSLLSFVLVGVIGFFILMGYGLRLMGNVQAGARPVLPEWDQWSDDLTRGFKLFVVVFVWSLPVVLVTLPSLVGGAMLDSGNEGAEAFGLILVLCGTCLSFAYALFLAVMQPGVTIAFARDERIRSGLDFTAIWRWTQAHLSDVVVVAIVYVVGSLIISTVAFLVGLIACGIGLLITIPLGTLIVTYLQYHLYGQLSVGSLGRYSSGSFGSEFVPDHGMRTAPSGVEATVVEPPVVQDPPVAPSATADRPDDAVGRDDVGGDGSENRPASPV